MSLLTALLYGVGGYGQGRQQRTQNEIAQAQVEEEKARTAAETKDAQLKAAQAGYDYNTLQPLPLKGTYEPLPKNATYEQITEWAARNYATALSRNDPVGIQQYGEATLKMPGGYAALTRGDYTAGPETRMADARTILYKAQAKAAEDLPARARFIAQHHDDTQIKIAGQRFANSIALAHYNGAIRLGIANLAGAYHLQGIQDQDAVRMAIADYDGKVKMYDAQMTSLQSLTDPNYVAPQQPQLTGPNVTYNFGPGGYNGPGGPPMIPVRGAGITPSKGPKILASDLFSGTYNQIKKGTPPQKLSDQIEAWALGGRITREMANTARSMFKLPPPSTGGSYAGQNPTRVSVIIPKRSIWDMLVQNGATPQEATTLTAVAMAESGGDAGNVNPNDPIGNGKTQTAWGLFQIGDGTHNEPPGWNDPETNTRMAIQKLRSQGLRAWGTYNTGIYKQYLPHGSG